MNVCPLSFECQARRLGAPHAPCRLVTDDFGRHAVHAQPLQGLAAPLAPHAFVRDEAAPHVHAARRDNSAEVGPHEVPVLAPRVGELRVPQPPRLDHRRRAATMNEIHQLEGQSVEVGCHVLE